MAGGTARWRSQAQEHMTWRRTLREPSAAGVTERIALVLMHDLYGTMSCGISWGHYHGTRLCRSVNLVLLTLPMSRWTPADDGFQDSDSRGRFWAGRARRCWYNGADNGGIMAEGTTMAREATPSAITLPRGNTGGRQGVERRGRESPEGDNGCCCAT